MKLLLKNIIFKERKTDVYIADGKIIKISPKINKRADERLDGRGEKALLPGLINSHTHAAMTLFRGYSDDLSLQDWLQKIWPLERKLTEDDIYWGTKLAVLEMLKTGTTCFNDMYWGQIASIEAVEEMGIRAVIGLVLLDGFAGADKSEVEKLWSILKKKKFETINFSLAPHAIYTVSKDNLRWAKNFARHNKLLLHTHLSETENEVKDCLAKYGRRPVEYLEKIGFLDGNCLLAHGLWLSDREVGILKERNCHVVYCPCSNMKLASGIFPYLRLKKAKIHPVKSAGRGISPRAKLFNGVNILLGTDSPASNNNLDLFEEMKFGCLLQRISERDALLLRDSEIFGWATKNSAKALKINSGEIRPGKLADLILIDLNYVQLVPGHNLISDLVYSAQGNAVSDVICNGRILMRDKKIEGEKEILARTKKIAKKLLFN